MKRAQRFISNNLFIVSTLALIGITSSLATAQCVDDCVCRCFGCIPICSCDGGSWLFVDPTLTIIEIRALTNENVDDRGDEGFDIFFGNGRINSQATLGDIGLPCLIDLAKDGALFGTSCLLTIFSKWASHPCKNPNLNDNREAGTAEHLAFFSNWEIGPL